MERRVLDVGSEVAGARLDRWLVTTVPGQSRAKLQALIEETPDEPTVAVEIVYTGDVQGVVSGGLRHGQRYLDNIDVIFEGTSLYTARWIETADHNLLKKFVGSNNGTMAEDHNGSPVFLARNAWHLKSTGEDWPGVRFLTTKEQVQ